MLRAQAWRQQLRLRLIQQLSDLGRDSEALQLGQGGWNGAVESLSLVTDNLYAGSGQFGRSSGRKSQFGFSSGGLGGGMGGGGGWRGEDWFEDSLRLGETGRTTLGLDVYNLSASDSAARYALNDFAGEQLEAFDRDARNRDILPRLLDETGYSVLSGDELAAVWDGESDADGTVLLRLYDGAEKYPDTPMPNRSLSASSGRYERLAKAKQIYSPYSRRPAAKAAYISDYRTIGEPYYRGYGEYRQPLLPVTVAPRLTKPRTKPIVSKWPAEAIELIKQLQLEADLRKLAGGVAIDRISESYHPRRGKLISKIETRQLFSDKAWLARGDRQRDAAPTLHWADEKERGTQSLGFDIALVRSSDPLDLQLHRPELLDDGSLTRWDEIFTDYNVKLERPGPNRVLLIAKANEGEVASGYEEHRWLIDTELHVVIEAERRYRGQLVDRNNFSKHVQIGGRWIATVAEYFNDQGKRTLKIEQKLQELSAEQFQTAWAAEQKLRESAITFKVPLPKFTDAGKESGRRSGFARRSPHPPGPQLPPSEICRNDYGTRSCRETGPG